VQEYFIRQALVSYFKEPAKGPPQQDPIFQHLSTCMSVYTDKGLISEPVVARILMRCPKNTSLGDYFDTFCQNCGVQRGSLLYNLTFPDEPEDRVCGPWDTFDSDNTFAQVSALTWENKNERNIVDESSLGAIQQMKALLPVPVETKIGLDKMKIDSSEEEEEEGTEEEEEDAEEEAKKEAKEGAKEEAKEEEEEEEKMSTCYVCSGSEGDDVEWLECDCKQCVHKKCEQLEGLEDIQLKDFHCPMCEPDKHWQDRHGVTSPSEGAKPDGWSYAYNTQTRCRVPLGLQTKNPHLTINPAACTKALKSLNPAYFFESKAAESGPLQSYWRQYWRDHHRMFFHYVRIIASWSGFTDEVYSLVKDHNSHFGDSQPILLLSLHKSVLANWVGASLADCLKGYDEIQGGTSKPEVLLGLKKVMQIGNPFSLVPKSNPKKRKRAKRSK